MMRKLFLNEPDFVSNESLKTFLRKESYYNVQEALKRAAERRKRRGTPADETKKSLADGATELDTNSHSQQWQSSKSKRKKPARPSWEDY